VTTTTLPVRFLLMALTRLVWRSLPACRLAGGQTDGPELEQPGQQHNGGHADAGHARRRAIGHPGPHRRRLLAGQTRWSDTAWARVQPEVVPG
jgi:hypothetical protein